MHEPRVLPQGYLANGKDAQHEQAITQTRHKAVPPGRTATLHAHGEWRLGEFPRIIAQDGHHKDSGDGFPELPPV
jgi:hypothetical protein